MKFFSILAFSFFSVAAGAVELHLATNSELLAELDRRLHGGAGSEGARALYSCDSSSRLAIELFNQQGAIKKADLYIGDPTVCDYFAATLSKYKAKIYSLQLVALCDSSARLHRYPLRPDGSFGAKTDTYVGDKDRCIKQADAINLSEK